MWTLTFVREEKQWCNSDGDREKEKWSLLSCIWLLSSSELPQNSAKELGFSLQSNRHGNLALLVGLGGGVQCGKRKACFSLENVVYFFPKSRVLRYLMTWMTTEKVNSFSLSQWCTLQRNAFRNLMPFIDLLNIRCTNINTSMLQSGFSETHFKSCQLIIYL